MDRPRKGHQRSRRAEASRPPPKATRQFSREGRKAGERECGLRGKKEKWRNGETRGERGEESQKVQNKVEHLQIAYSLAFVILAPGRRGQGMAVVALG